MIATEGFQLEGELRAAPEGRIAVVVTLGVRDDQPRGVLAEFGVIYEIADMTSGKDAEDSIITDSSEFLGSLSKGSQRWLVDRALDDATPYLRESIQSLSIRLTPNKPLLVNKLPSLSLTDEVDGEPSNSE